jgi:competence protein ComEC
MQSAIIGFVAGIGWLQLQASLPSPFLMIVLAAAAVILCVWVRYFSSILVKIAMHAIVGSFAGFVWAAGFAHFYLADELPRELEGTDITVVGTVDSLPYRFEHGVRFNLAVEQAQDASGGSLKLPSKIALSSYSGYDSNTGYAIGAIQPGERWQLNVRLRRPHGNANQYGFDYEAWLLEQKLRATGYVRPDVKAAHKNARLHSFVPSAKHYVENLRSQLREKILTALPDKEYAGVIVALVVGDQRGIAQSDWEIFNRSGIGHLISISGLHITMIAGLFAAIVSVLWRRSFFTNLQLPLLLPAQKAAALSGALAALVYVALAGFGIPAQRTLYMLAVVAAALWYGRITSVSSVLCLALGTVLVIDPWAVLSPGFWLSFSAVAIILFVSAGRAPRLQTDESGEAESRVLDLLAAARLQLAITVGLVPLTMLLFGQVSLISPIANAVAIPLISFVVTPLCLIGSFLPLSSARMLLDLSHALVEWLAGVLTLLTKFSFAVWSAPVPPWWMFLIALVGTIWALAPRGWPVRWIGVLGWIPLLLNMPMHPDKGEMWATAFDIGQGMAVLVETEQHRILYDTGPVYTPESDGGNRVIVPYLKARGITVLDAVMISHNDNDHSGGAISVFNEIDVRKTFSSLDFDSAIVQRAPDHSRCQAGQAWTWDGVQFELLFPVPESYERERAKPNTRSCTLKITVGDYALLLPGDIEAAQESELMNADAQKLAASVLLAPHHGSGTSSTLPFLQAVSPKMALFQVGYRNRYRHPKQEVYERYRELGIERFRNDESGAIALHFGQGIKVSEYRKQVPRYWHGR